MKVQRDTTSKSSWRPLGSALLFAAAGMVSSALEVFFTISASLLVRQLWLRRRG